MEINKKTTIQEWLLNGVTYKEVQERLSWLGISMTMEEIISYDEPNIRKEAKMLKLEKSNKDLNSGESNR